MRRSDSGQAILEGVFVITLVFLSTCFSLELVRRGYLEFLLYHSTFLAVREAGLHRASISPSSKDLFNLWEETLGLKWAQTFRRRALIETQENGQGVQSKIWFRYPALVSFSTEQSTKHHFEVTKKCLFPLSLH